MLSMQGQKALGFHQIYLNLCLKMNEGTGLEWHEGELLMTEFSFLGELTLCLKHLFLLDTHSKVAIYIDSIIYLLH